MSGEPIVIADDVSVTMAFACENFSQDPQQRLYFHTVVDQLNALTFPIVTPSLIVVFSFQRSLPGFLMQCVVDIVPNNGDPVASQPLNDVVFKPDQPNSRQIVILAGITWPRPGNYVVRFRSRGKTLASFVLPVVQVQLAGPTKR